MREEQGEGRWGVRLAKATLWTGAGGAVLGGLGAYGSGWGFWPFQTGFLIIGVGILLGLLGLILGVIAFFLNRKRPGHGRRIAIGLLGSLIFLSIIGYWGNRGAKAPPIHDITTDLGNPPAFATLPLSKDRLLGVKGGEAEWRRLHAGAYGRLKPLTLPGDAATVAAVAKSVVKERGWEIAYAGADRVEATATDSPFKFKDDVVISFTLGPQGKGTIVNMRSVSRVGVSDLGVNAERIEAFLSDLEKAAATAK